MAGIMLTQRSPTLFICRIFSILSTLSNPHSMKNNILLWSFRAPVTFILLKFSLLFSILTKIERNEIIQQDLDHFNIYFTAVIRVPVASTQIQVRCFFLYFQSTIARKIFLNCYFIAIHCIYLFNFQWKAIESLTHVYGLCICKLVQSK